MKNNETKNRAKYASYTFDKSKDRPQSFGKTLKRFIVHMKPQWGSLLVVIISGIIGAIMYTMGPLKLGNVIDSIQNQVNIKLSGGQVDILQIVWALLFIFGIYAIYALTSFVQWHIMAKVTQDVTKSLRNKINAKLSKMPLKYFDNRPRGDIMSCVVNDADNIQLSLQNNILQTISSVVTFFGILIIMIVVSPKMTLVSVCTLPVGLVVALILAKQAQKNFRKQWRITGELNGHIEEMATGHNIVKSFGYEKRAVEEFDDINTDLFKVSRKAQFITGTIMPFMNFINNFGYVLICIVGAMFVLNKEITIGVVISFVTYAKLFTQPLVEMANISNNLQSSMASAERIFNVLDEEEESFEEKVDENRDVKGVVEFEDVSFSYSDDVPLIENLNFRANPGQLVAIVGHTGAGKTTIVNLLMRFYEVGSGKIKIDGTNITDITRENLRKIFGMVLQDTWLFNGTIKDNIAYGRDNATDDMIFSAAKSACVHDFIESLPDGYNTVIDEDGGNISQGQKQLITIARTILADPSVLILDEATSSVDTRTEKKVQEAMNHLMNGRTSFVIAHRLSTIREADVILVMEDGAIVESGSHDELMEKGGVYHELYVTQYSAVNQ